MLTRRELLFYTAAVSIAGATSTVCTAEDQRASKASLILNKSSRIKSVMRREETTLRLGGVLFVQHAMRRPRHRLKERHPRASPSNTGVNEPQAQPHDVLCQPFACFLAGVHAGGPSHSECRLACLPIGLGDTMAVS